MCAGSHHHGSWYITGPQQNILDSKRMECRSRDELCRGVIPIETYSQSPRWETQNCSGLCSSSLGHIGELSGENTLHFFPQSISGWLLEIFLPDSMENELECSLYSRWSASLGKEIWCPITLSWYTTAQENLGKERYGSQIHQGNHKEGDKLGQVGSHN